MPTFKISNLPDRTKTMHYTHVRWRKKNWNDSLKNHNQDIEDLLAQLELFDIWKNRLPKNEAIKYLMREIYTDAYMSINLACVSLYKNSYMTLRSQFETAMRLIYFSNHPFEFSLWQSGDEKWTLELLRGSDVWGNNFKYFSFIAEVSKLEDIAPTDLRLISRTDTPRLKEVYSKLSKYVHSGGPFLQTKSGRLSPKYNLDEFTSWQGIFRDVQMYVNILFALCFSNQFRANSFASS